MLNSELLALLVCPETHQDVLMATPDEIAQINEAIRLGQVRTAAGNAVKDPVEGALVRTDRTIAYPIRDGIPVMLVDEGLAIPHVKLNGHG
jgi:uncharacterized protein